MPESLATAVVIADTNVLINFIHIGQLSLLSALPAVRIGLPLEVLDELTDADQRRLIEEEIIGKNIDLIHIVDVDALALFGDLRDVMGRGEAACLALATVKGYYLASDEKRRFRRKAIELIGEDRLLRTEDLMMNAIRHGCITVRQADEFKSILAQNRYVMSFDSFSEWYLDKTL
jgi:predicted nucleic acid-binding protein